MRAWMFGSRRVITFEEFVPDLQRFLRDGSITMVVLDNETGAPGGFARAYSLNLADGWAWVGCYFAPQLRLRPLVFAEGAAQFITYLFSLFPVRKLYAEVHQFNHRSQRLVEKLGFRPEGRLTEHAWLNDRYWDVINYSLGRDDWREAYERVKRISGVEAALERAGHEAVR